VCSAILPLAAEKGLVVNQVISADLPLLLADEARLRQILINLLSNAIKFTETGSVSIQANADQDKQQIRIAVADTGVGIPEEAFDSIFDEFQQVDGTSTRQHGGTGLGLAISRRLARMHDGDITVESQPGKGSTFTVSLPVAGDQTRSTSQ
jgi:signal transduction histidine kinase